jgi:hypothetical protein
MSCLITDIAPTLAQGVVASAHGQRKGKDTAGEQFSSRDNAVRLCEVQTRCTWARLW